MTWSDSKPIISKTQYEIDVAAPYRLGFTVSALRRLSTNIVDVLTLEDEYVRALDGFRKPVLVRVTQTQPATVAITLERCVNDGACHRAPVSWSRPAQCSDRPMR